MLASERAAFQWGWLEQMLAATPPPAGLMAAWNTPLRSGRMAICRVMHSSDVVAGAHWSVGVLVLEAAQYDWILGRLCAAISDSSLWRAGHFLKQSGLDLPDWTPDPPVSREERAAMREMIQRGALNAPATVSGTVTVADPQVLRLPMLVDTTQRMRLRWCVGLPQAAPGSIVATVRPLETQRGEQVAARRLSAGTPPPLERSEDRPHGARAASASHHGETASEELAGTVSFDPPYKVTLKQPTRAAWGVPAVCVGLMLAAMLAAWWIVRGGTLPAG